MERPRLRIRSGLLSNSQLTCQGIKRTNSQSNEQDINCSTAIVISDDDSEEEDPLVAFFHSSFHEVVKSQQEFLVPQRSPKPEVIDISDGRLESLVPQSSPKPEVIDISDDDQPSPEVSDCLVIDCGGGDEDVKEDKKDIEEVTIEANSDDRLILAALTTSIQSEQMQHICSLCLQQFCTEAGLSRHRKQEHKRWGIA
jgi:hypothetical protein